MKRKWMQEVWMVLLRIMTRKKEDREVGCGVKSGSSLPYLYLLMLNIYLPYDPAILLLGNKLSITKRRMDT